MHGGLDNLPAGHTYPLMIGIQVFQHGDRCRTHALVRAAQARTARGGLFCLRVNAVGTGVRPPGDLVETAADGGVTVRHQAGLLVHLFAADELHDLFAAEFEPVLAPRADRTGRRPHWEAIWRKRHQRML